MNARSVWCGLQWKLQKRQPEMQTLVMLTLRSDLPRDDRLVVDRLAAQHVGRLAELVQRRTVVKHIGLLARQRLALQALFIYWFECVHTQSTISKSNVRRRRSADLTRTLTGVPSVKVRP